MKRYNQTGYTKMDLVFVIIFLIIILALIPWGINIYKFARCDFEAPYKTEVLRGVGIPVFLLGMAIGFSDIGEEEEE